MSKGYIENSIMLSKSLIKLCVCWGRGGGGLFYYTTDAASLVKGVKSCWDTSEETTRPSLQLLNV